MKDLRQKMEGKSNFSRRLKQFDGLTWLTLTPLCCTTDLSHCRYAPQGSPSYLQGMNHSSARVL